MRKHQYTFSDTVECEEEEGGELEVGDNLFLDNEVVSCLRTHVAHLSTSLEDKSKDVELQNDLQECINLYYQ